MIELPKRTLFLLTLDMQTLFESFQKAAQQEPEHQFLGYRTEKSYSWLTYQQVLEKSKLFISGLSQVKQDFKLGLYSINRPEWVISELGCYYRNHITVPLYDTLDKESLKFIIQEAEIEVVATTASKVSLLLDLEIQTIVLFDLDVVPENIQLMATEKGVQVFSFKEILEKGKLQILEQRECLPSDTATICYTSGTTGKPKGVVLTHQNILASAYSIRYLALNQKFPLLNKNDVHISYLPLAHVFERVIIHHLIMGNCRIGFYQGDTTKLLDDIQILRPTIFISVPRIFNKLYHSVMAKVKETGGLKQKLFFKAYEKKQKNLNNGIQKHFFYDLIFKKIRQRLGGRVRMIFSGSAPLETRVLDFLRICFSCPVFEGYGQTETAAGISVTSINEFKAGHVGVPLPCCEVKLVDVPHMNYLTSDPIPRGEIYVRGPQVFKEYYKNPEKTAETLKDGWCATGDIGQFQNGNLQIIDREKNMFKLSQGEFISPENIESTYLKHPLVSSIFVYGDPLRSQVVGIIYPEQTEFKKFLEQNNLTEDEIPKAFLNEINQNAKVNGLKGYETLYACHLTKEDFAIIEENKTPTWKIRRDVVKKSFGQIIEKLYE